MAMAAFVKKADILEMVDIGLPVPAMCHFETRLSDVKCPPYRVGIHLAAGNLSVLAKL
jgi:hypothetical protein